MRDETLPLEARLSHSAAKLLLHLLRRGGVWGTSAEMMRGAGIVNRGVYRRAKLDLEGVDLFTYCTQLFSERTRDVQRVNMPVQSENTRVQSENIPVQRVNTPSVQPVNIEWVEEPVSILSQCVEADRMPDGGNPMQPSSPFAFRRRAQVRALAAGFAELFPGEQLSEADAKEYLRCCDNSAEAAYEAIRDIKGKAKRIDSPKAYVKATLRRMAEEFRPQPQPSASVVAPLPPVEAPTGELPPPTPEMRATWAEGARQMDALGINWRN
jgi:hypothetical protein